jgi:hypothetical protein
MAAPLENLLGWLLRAQYYVLAKSDRKTASPFVSGLADSSVRPSDLGVFAGKALGGLGDLAANAIGYAVGIVASIKPELDVSARRRN